MTATRANETQVAGTHYMGTDVIQPWDIVLQCYDGRFLEGNIVKYTLRCRKKAGVVDLKKAAHYCDKLSETYFMKESLYRRYLFEQNTVRETLQVALGGYNIPAIAARLLFLLHDWDSVADLGAVRSMLAMYAEEYDMLVF